MVVLFAQGQWETVGSLPPPSWLALGDPLGSNPVFLPAPRLTKTNVNSALRYRWSHSQHSMHSFSCVYYVRYVPCTLWSNSPFCFMFKRTQIFLFSVWLWRKVVNDTPNFSFFLYLTDFLIPNNYISFSNSLWTHWNALKCHQNFFSFYKTTRCFR